MKLFTGKSLPQRYAYINARVKAMKAKLLPKETYTKLLVMDIPEITRFIGETEYKAEINELAPKFSGIDLIEYALSLNLARTFHKLISISQDEAKLLITAYLRKWDAWNIKTILRGKTQGAPEEKILETLIPAGEFAHEFLARLAKSNIDEILQALEKESPEVHSIVKDVKTKKLSDIEDELDKLYYARLLKSAKSGMSTSTELFKKFVKIEIDIENLKSLFRLKRYGLEGKDVLEHLIPNGLELREDELNKLSTLSFAEFVKSLEQYTYWKSISDVVKPEMESLIEVETRLDKYKIEYVTRISHYYPLSILPIMGYISSKKVEVDNLRIIARGKESGLESDVIKDQLVI